MILGKMKVSDTIYFQKTMKNLIESIAVGTYFFGGGGGGGGGLNVAGRGHGGDFRQNPNIKQPKLL